MARHSCYAVTWADPKPKASLDYCIPEKYERSVERVFHSRYSSGLWELVRLTCRDPSIQLLGYTRRAEVLEMTVCCGTQFVERPLGGTLQTVMTKSGLEAKSSVTKGVGS